MEHKPELTKLQRKLIEKAKLNQMAADSVPPEKTAEDSPAGVTTHPDNTQGIFVVPAPQETIDNKEVSNGDHDINHPQSPVLKSSTDISCSVAPSVQSANNLTECITVVSASGAETAISLSGSNGSNQVITASSAVVVQDVTPPLTTTASLERIFIRDSDAESDDFAITSESLIDEGHPERIVSDATAAGETLTADHKVVSAGDQCESKESGGQQSPLSNYVVLELPTESALLPESEDELSCLSLDLSDIQLERTEEMRNDTEAVQRVSTETSEISLLKSSLDVSSVSPSINRLTFQSHLHHVAVERELEKDLEADEFPPSVDIITVKSSPTCDTDCSAELPANKTSFNASLPPSLLRTPFRKSPGANGPDVLRPTSDYKEAIPQRPKIHTASRTTSNLHIKASQRDSGNVSLVGVTLDDGEKQRNRNDHYNPASSNVISALGVQSDSMAMVHTRSESRRNHNDSESTESVNGWRYSVRSVESEDNEDCRRRICCRLCSKIRKLFSRN